MTILSGWPFWAPSDMASVERALDLARAAPGERVVDLGCGDGQVLVAAARRGCAVAGVEVDADLVEQARNALDVNGLEGEVVHGDVFDFPLEDADVIFTYLAPATLQRLVPRLQRCRDARLVTVDFAVPGLVPTDADGTATLYRLPASRSAIGPAGWGTGGLLVAVTPDRHSLTCLAVGHPGGAVDVVAVGGLAGRVAVATGKGDAAPGESVAVDLRWEELAEGAFVVGALRCTGAPDLPVFAFVTSADDGIWEVTADGIDELRARLASGWVPATFGELLDACDG